MFYVPHKRIWIIIEPYELESDQQGAKLIIAGSGDRHQKEFAQEFQAFSQLLDKYVSK